MPPITVTVNGEKRQVPPGCTVRQLVEDLALGRAAVAVELNRQVVPRSLHESTTLEQGDTLEVVTLVGGG